LARDQGHRLGFIQRVDGAKERGPRQPAGRAKVQRAGRCSEEGEAAGAGTAIEAGATVSALEADTGVLLSAVQAGRLDRWIAGGGSSPQTGRDLSGRSAASRAKRLIKGYGREGRSRPRPSEPEVLSPGTGS